MTVFHLVYRWVQIPVHGQNFMQAILKSAEWPILRTALLERIKQERVEETVFHTVVPSLLLVVMSASTTALGDECTEALSTFFEETTRHLQFSVRGRIKSFNAHC